METVMTNEVSFDVFKTLYMIKIDDDLLSVFNMGVNTSIQTAITNAKNGLLSDKTLEYLEGIHKLIVENESYLEKYLKLTHNYNTEVVETTGEEFSFPRRYGKDKILSDIKGDDRKSTQIEKAMFSLNSIKNMYVNLERRLIHDLFVERGAVDGELVLTDEECRDIVAIQKLMETKLKSILNKKVRKSANKIKTK